MRNRPKLYSGYLSDEEAENQVDLIDEVKKGLKLSVVEEGIFDSILNLFLAGDLTSLQHLNRLNNALINKDHLDLLDYIPEREIKQYSKDFLDMINKSQKNTIEDFTDEEILAEIKERGLSTSIENISITEELEMREWNNLFYSLSSAQKECIIMTYGNK